MLSTAEVARMAGVSEAMVRRAIHSGDLPATRVGSNFVIEETDAEQWIESLDDDVESESDPEPEEDGEEDMEEEEGPEEEEEE